MAPPRQVNGGFYFVPVDDPAGRQSKKRPESQRYAKEARKHVMKDIGFSRRKEKAVKAPRTTRISLEWVDGVEQPSSFGSRETQLAHRPAHELHVRIQHGGFAESSEVVEDEDDAREEETYHVKTNEPINQQSDLPWLAKRLGSGRIDPFARYPVDLGDRAKYLLDTLLNPHVHGLRAFRIAWYNVAMLDEGVFHQVLSISAIALGKLRHETNEAETEVFSKLTIHPNWNQAMYYHNKALHSVNERLGDPIEGHSDGVVASVIGFACHSRQCADYDVWLMHMKGLKRILAARGGPDSLKPYNLRLLLYLIDTAGACTRDIRPFFDLPVVILPDVKMLHSKVSVKVDVEKQMQVWCKRISPNRRAIADIVRDLSLVVQWFESNVAEDPTFYQPSNVSGIWIVPLIHRCLSLIAEDLDAEERGPCYEIHEILRHAIILFAQPIRRRFGIVTGSSDLRIRKLKEFLIRNLHHWEGMEQLLLWILISGGIEATTVPDQIWFASIIATHPSFEDMDEADYISLVRSFIWMDDVFEAPMFQLMSQVTDVKNAAPVWPVSRSQFEPCAGGSMKCSRALYSTLSNLLEGNAEEDISGLK